ncbi:Antitoxin Phd_YefM, type II toxin-antitoxin system [Acididesulfobacillus acetoxydans]|uniref:Antitoxin n=1 Tax=Acididesulfobacillus acetoxydans TaxID=1561005 RepID=A0A8S0WXH5_9FIRM|nr:type II toxin-antitoxin system prevent-host-death family antitoxin [Acididesulfobacillus acetoxydans]CAA7600971.1 Antitoxin Phd_YefM, type II toxin-antitoxin system [Acididesulfobacillus acetoxydans]CEJ07694.1 Antitoxin Phd_YefM, type II toxin-antitoxin system [Acididesulfobacillus acetoxydans]
MLAVNYSTLRNDLKKFCDYANNDFETIIVTRKSGGNVVLLSEAEYNNLMENLYVRSDPEYYKKLLKSIEELKAREVVKADFLDE